MPTTTLREETEKIRMALASVEGATAQTIRALDAFLEATIKIHEVLQNAKRMPNSESPLLHAQFVVRDAQNALQLLEKGLANMPQRIDLQTCEAPNLVAYEDEAVEKLLIGPLNLNDVLKEGDLIFLHRNPAGNRLFRRLTGPMVGRKLDDTPFHIVYRLP